MFSKRIPSPYTVGFIVLMFIAAGEALFFAALVGQQKNDASLNNLGGPQRMRTQRIAFLAEASIAPGLSPAERNELGAAIDTIDSTQHELDGDASTRIGTMLPGGETDLERDVTRYARAASEVLAHPKDAAAANAYLLANRLPLLKALDAAVEARKTASEARKRMLWSAIVGLLGLMAVLVVLAWRFVVVPLERYLMQSREHLRSLFEDNPDSVTTYDLDGKIVDANAAASALTGFARKDLLGRAFAQAIPQEQRSGAYLAFARSAAGDAAKLETTVLRPDGTSCDVSSSLLPSIVDGRIDGVYAISRDVTQERRAERELVEQAKRIRELYLVAASGTESSETQMRRALELGCNRLGMEWGFVSQVSGDVATIRASVGNGTYATGESVRIDRALLRTAIANTDVLVIEDPRKDPVAADPSQRSGKLGAFMSFSIVIDSVIYGAVCFASSKKRDVPLAASDRDFIRLIGALIGASIERGEARRRLDAMAFSDPLTGLPNRASLNESIEELIGKARRSDARFAVHFLDLDDFKAVNDERGHAVGDELLKIVANRLRETIGEDCIAARLGGDEFIILQPGAATESEAGTLAARVIAAIDAPAVIAAGPPVSVGASIGIAIFPGDGTDVQTLFANADRALYVAKSAGRGRYFCATAVAATP